VLHAPPPSVILVALQGAARPPTSFTCGTPPRSMAGRNCAAP
jgi:hypothetical protein